MGQGNSTVDGATPRFLVYGKTGWIGGLLGEELERRGVTWAYGRSRIEDRRGILEDIKRVRRLVVVVVVGHDHDDDDDHRGRRGQRRRVLMVVP